MTALQAPLIWAADFPDKAPRREDNSAKVKAPGHLSRIRPEIFDFEPEFRLEQSQTKPKIPDTVPTNRRATIPNDYEPISACFDDDPKLFNCEIAQSSLIWAAEFPDKAPLGFG